MQERKQIGRILVDRGVITETQLNEVLEQAKKSKWHVGDILIEKKYAPEEDVYRALADQIGLAYVELKTYEIDPEVKSLLPEEFIQKKEVVPLFSVEGSLHVATHRPLDVDLIDEAAALAGGLRIRPIVSSPKSIKHALAKWYGQQTVSMVSMDSVTKASGDGESDAPVIKFVDDIIREGVDLEASDIHLEPQEKSFYYRFRVDGILREPIPVSVGLRAAITSRIKILADMDISETRKPQDGRIEYDVDGGKIDLRIASFPTIYGEHLSIRILNKSQGILTIDQLGLDGAALDQFKDLIQNPHGIILVTGPTGSGKTTSLYASIEMINDETKNILTLEDPVEYAIPKIHHSQINIKAGLTFAGGLRAMMRMDPDIIMIGEIRDKETAEIAIHASLTGHLVFSTIHTNDAASAVTRLVNMGVEPYMIATSLVGVLAQRLVRVLCPHCKQERPITEKEIELIKMHAPEEVIPGQMYDPKGCSQCHNIGYKGRTGVFELLMIDQSKRDLIVKKAQASEIAELAISQGMVSMRTHGVSKVARGITTLSDVLSETQDS